MNKDLNLIYKAYTWFKYKPGREVKSVFKGFPEIDSQPTPSSEIKHQKILFCPFAPHHLNIIREGIWAHACKLRGAEVKMITYDLFQDAIDFLNPNIKKDLSVSYKISKQLYGILKLPYIAMGDHLKKTNTKSFDFDNLQPTQIESLKHKDIFLGDLVIASSVRYFFCNGPEWDNPDFLKKARQFAKTAIILTDIYESILLEEKPDKIVSSHGIYVSWGTLFRLARKMDIPIDIYGASYRKNTLRFYHNVPQAPFPEGEWANYKGITLSPGEVNLVDKYFTTRETQKEDSISLFDGDNSLPDDLVKFISRSKKEKRKLFCLFTNISWDSFMYRKESENFKTIIEWLQANIQIFQDNSNVDLIIKAHPAEKYHKVPDKYRIKNCLPKQLPENIYFISETANVKPFDIYKQIDVGLVYTSTVCLEMAMNRIPVLSSGVGGHYEGRGFTIDPTTKEEYINTLQDLIKGTYSYEPNIDAARRYLYFRFFREAIQFDLVELKGFAINNLKFKTIDDLRFGKNKNLDIITNGILNDAVYINE